MSEAWKESEVDKDGRWKTSLLFPASSLAALAVNQFGFVVMPTDILLYDGEVIIKTPAR